MPSFSLATRAATVALAALVTGCASRQVPSRYPTESPLSSRATPAPVAHVTTSLEAEPGASATAPEPASHQHEGHGQHGHAPASAEHAPDHGIHSHDAEPPVSSPADPQEGHHGHH